MRGEEGWGEGCMRRGESERWGVVWCGGGEGWE